MPDALGKIGKVIGIGSAGAGIFGNIMNAITRGKQVGRLEDAEKKFASLTPEQLAGLVSRAEQPLGQDLLQTVGNTVQADMASRGLAEAPGIFAATESQALAPYKIEQQRMALELVMKQLGLPIEYAKAVMDAAGPGVDMSKILAMLMNMSGTNQVPDTLGSSNEAEILGKIISQGAPVGVPTFPGSSPPGTGGGAEP